MTEPLRPEEVPPLRNSAIPDQVISVFNRLIVKHYGRESATIQIGEARKALEEHYTKEEIKENHYLDVEPLFEEYGWDVRYEGPAYNETFEGYYTFRKK